MRVRGPNNAGRAVQTDPTLLRYASVITEQKNAVICLLKNLTSFKLCTKTPNNTQKHAAGCWELLANNAGSVFTEQGSGT